MRRLANPTHEEVIRVWIRPANLEQFHQVVELTMDITTDCYWTFLQGTLVSGLHSQGGL
jgi:hypothetical protein